MGWFSNIVTGKQDPIEAYEAPQKPLSQTDAKGVAETDPHKDSSGAKIMPEVVIDKVDCHTSGDMKHLELWAVVYNRSPFEVEIRKFEVLGQASDPGRFLKPHEKYEIKVYSGETPRNDSDKRVIIQYKIVENCDYFQSNHHISYKLEHFEQTDYYLPCKMSLEGLVHDL